MREWIRQALPTVLASLVVSTVGGASGTYVSYKLIEQRVATIEGRQAEDRAAINELRTRMDTNLSSLRDQVSDVRGDVKYIRGRLESLPRTQTEKER